MGPSKVTTLSCAGYYLWLLLWLDKPVTSSELPESGQGGNFNAEEREDLAFSFSSVPQDH
jgi:hypothetical protein